MDKKKNAAPDIPASGATTDPPRLRRRSIPGAAPRHARPRNGDARANPSYEEIAEAAYHRYLSRNGSQGSAFDDWIESERDLRSRSKPGSP